MAQPAGRTAPFGAQENFAARAGALRRRLRSSVDSGGTIRADRDRDEPARPAMRSTPAPSFPGPCFR